MSKVRIGDIVRVLFDNATYKIITGDIYKVVDVNGELPVIKVYEDRHYTIVSDEYEIAIEAYSETAAMAGLKKECLDDKSRLLDLHNTEKTKTTGIKFDGGKPDMSLIPMVALVKEAEAFMVGAKKYGRYNYCKGHDAHQLAAAMLRHITAWFNGEENDPVDGQSHLGSVRACAAMILRQQELGTLRDNRFKPEVKNG